MNTIRKTILMGVLVLLASVGMPETSMAQFESNNATIRDLVRRIQTDTSDLRSSVQNASDRGNYRMNELKQLIADFEAATAQFDRRLATRRVTSDDARFVLDRATPIDNFFVNSRIRSGTLGDWQRLRSDLDQLAL